MKKKKMATIRMLGSAYTTKESLMKPYDSIVEISMPKNIVIFIVITEQNEFNSICFLKLDNIVVPPTTSD